VTETAHANSRPPFVPRLVKAFPDFFEDNRNVLGTRDAFRKRLERRHENGLVASGAVVETSLGVMVDPPRFWDWLLNPGEDWTSKSDSEAAA
jgi:hypothetical protein